MRSIHACLALALLALLLGCGKRAVSTPPGPLNQMFASWESGRQDQAVRLLCSIDWNDPELLSDAPALFALTEQEFTSGWRYPKRMLTQKILPSVTLSRDLALRAIALGQAAQETGDTQRAKTHYNAVRKLGAYLSQPERLEVAKLLAKAILALADEQLSQVDSPVNGSEGS
jgi:hypothetical protein